MSMESSLLRVSKQELESYLKDCSLLQKKLAKEEEIIDNPILLQIDSAWDGINFLLTGESIETDHDLGEVMLPDLAINEEQDFGYGPALYLLPERVNELSQQIFNLGTKEMEARYDGAKMDILNIYPGNWEDKDEMLNYLLDYFEEVQGFYAEAAKEKEALIIILK